MAGTTYNRGPHAGWRPPVFVKPPMPEFSSLPGQPALSAFRLDRLLERLKAVEPVINGLDAHHVHLVWSERALSPDEAARLRALLDVPSGVPASDGA